MTLVTHNGVLVFFFGITIGSESRKQLMALAIAYPVDVLALFGLAQRDRITRISCCISRSTMRGELNG